MKIAVLGTGTVGQIIAEKFTEVGHEVIMGSRDIGEALARSKPDNFGRPPFHEWHSEHTVVRLATYQQAAEEAELIVNATNGSGSLAALEQAGAQNLSGKVILDIANPLDSSQGFPPSLFISNTDSLGEQIQRQFPDARVVKSLNTMTVYIMVNPALIPGDHNVFLSGNDAEAKNQVKQILKSFGWKESNMIDVGGIPVSMSFVSRRQTEQRLPDEEIETVKKESLKEIDFYFDFLRTLNVSYYF